jgi:hypothetical protein
VYIASSRFCKLINKRRHSIAGMVDIAASPFADDGCAVSPKALGLQSLIDQISNRIKKFDVRPIIEKIQIIKHDTYS